MPDPSSVKAALLARSNRLGADPRNTNYAGGNTSAKGTATDPVTGGDIELMWVKGSGGDLGTLTEPGLAVLRLDRLRALTGVYPGVEREDEMVAAFDYCLHGKGGAAPSIDTAMHGLVDAAHVDHLHPDSGIALACAADGEALTEECFGDQVVWVPWRRPGFQLGLDIAAVKEANPRGHRLRPRRARHHRLGCDVRGVRAQLPAHHPHRRGVPRRARPAGTVRAGARRVRAACRGRTPGARRRARPVRPRAGLHRPPAGRATSPTREPVLDFLARAEHPRLAALGTSCPDHFLRTKVRPLVLDLPAGAPLEEAVARLTELHAAYREEYRAYYERHADAGSPAMRGADPADRAGARASACSASARTSRPHGWRASSTSTRST